MSRTTIAFYVFVLLLIGTGTWASRDHEECLSTARVVGRGHTWDPIHGCNIEYKSGKWAQLQRASVLP